MEQDDFDEPVRQDVEDQDLDPNHDPATSPSMERFSLLEQNYTRLVNEMQDDPTMQRYLDGFVKLFDFLYMLRERSQEVAKEKNRLEDELAESTQKLDESLEVIKADTVTITSLNTEIKKSHNLIDNAHEREQAAQEIIDNLRKQIANLNSEIEFKNKMGQTVEDEAPQVSKHREALEREKVKLISEVSKLNEKLTNALAYQEELERRTSSTDIKIQFVTAQLEETSCDVEKYKRTKDRLEGELQDAHLELLKRDAEIKNLGETIANDHKVIIKCDSHLKEQTTSAVKCFKELEAFNIRYSKLQDEYDQLFYETETLKKIYDDVIKTLQSKEGEKKKLLIDITKLNNQRDAADHRMKMMDYERTEALQDRNKIREVINTMERDINMHKHQTDIDKRTIENQMRERDVLQKNLLRQVAVSRDHVKLIKLQEQRKKKLDTEIESRVAEERKQSKHISYLERERDRLMEEAMDKNKKMEDVMEELKLQKTNSYDLQKMLAQNENKLRMQQNNFDAVRADRNAIQKNLAEFTAENNEIRTQLKISRYQNEQLKEDVSSKVQGLLRQETKQRKMMKERDDMKVELDTMNEKNRALKEEISIGKSEAKRLHKAISDADRMLKDQTKTITALMNERDVLGTQFVRRNDELAMLYEKVQLLQTTLHHGEFQYEQRLADIKLLKLEIRRIRQDKLLLGNSINNTNDLKQEIFHVERDLTRERMKSKALEEELHNPMNVHRWRKLEGTDPDVFELLQKVNLLQKRIVNQASKMLDRERQLKESEKLYLNLRHMVAKQPGPDLQQRLNSTQRALFNSTARMKCLVSEMNMLELNNRQFKMQLIQANDELRTVKLELVNEKKKQVKLTRALHEATDTVRQQMEVMTKPSLRLTMMLDRKAAIEAVNKPPFPVTRTNSRPVIRSQSSIQMPPLGRASSVSVTAMSSTTIQKI